jgi:hypothetical protein
MAGDLPVAVFELKEYMIIFRQLEVVDFLGIKAKVRSIVRCTGKGLQNADEYRLDIYFLSSDSPYPEPIVNLAERVGTIFMPMSDMAMVVDVLRNESPLYGHLRADHPAWTGITTTNEPIGAGDEDYAE